MQALSPELTGTYLCNSPRWDATVQPLGHCGRPGFRLPSRALLGLSPAPQSTSLQAVSKLTVSISFSSPHGAVVKHSPANAGDTGDTRWIPGSRRSPEEENNPLQYSLIARLAKSLPAMQETVVRFLGWEDPTWTSLVAQLVKNPP